MARGPKTEKHVLSYPRDLADPKDWLNFVELDPFSPSWKRLGLNDEDLRALQISICSWPDPANVIQGTGGLRKIRFAPRSWNTGKSGAARVYYAYFPEYGLVALIYAHSKDQMEAISDEQKKVIKKVIQEVQRHLDANAAAFGRKGRS